MVQENFIGSIIFLQIWKEKRPARLMFFGFTYGLGGGLLSHRCVAPTLPLVMTAAALAAFGGPMKRCGFYRSDAEHFCGRGDLTKIF